MQRLYRFLKVRHLQAIKFFSLLFFFWINAQTLFAAPTDDFVTTWKTDNYGVSNSTSILVPMVGGPYEVDWDNDGVFDESGLYDTASHDYGVAGTYTIRIRGGFSSIKIDGSLFFNPGDAQKIISLDQWGTHAWSSMNRAFKGASYLVITATDVPDFSAVTDMSFMFQSAVFVNPDTSGWDTSSVTDMSNMFSDTGSANPDTSAWDTSSVTNMSGIFFLADSANPDTSGWDTTSVTDMSYMFYNAIMANPDTSGWDTSSVSDMRWMFHGATAANPDVSGWDTSSVQYMDNMFHNATAFDRDIGAWDVTSLVSAEGMFEGATLSLANYESLLTGWDAQVLQSGVVFSGGDSVYCSTPAMAARANMIVSDSWIITDGGEHCPPPAPGLAPDMTPETDTGAFDDDDITTDSTPAFYVQCSAPGNYITLYTDNPVAGTETGERLCKTSGIETATSTRALAVGAHNITYTDRIGGAESGHSPALPITVDPPAPSDDFVTTWQTNKSGISNSTSIMVPMVGGPYEVDWDNDGVFDESGLHDTATHDFGVAGTYTIRIRGAFSSIRFAYRGDRAKILSLNQWGTKSWTSMESAFAGAYSLQIPAPDKSDFSAVTNMSHMFDGAGQVNPDTSGWDTSSVTDMSWMFVDAHSAKPDTSGWDTTSVTDMSYMFYHAYLANPDTSGWDTSSVSDMRWMFHGAAAANPDTSNWNTSSVTSMTGMFMGAAAFDRDIGSWDVTALTIAEGMFDGVTLSLVNYESLLTGWNAQALQPGVTFSGGNSTYCSAAAAAARANMMGTDSWVITDGGKSCPPGYTCNVNIISSATEYFDAIHEACEVLVLGPDFIAADGSNVAVSSGWEIEFMPGFTVEKGATLDAAVCGQSLCLGSPDPMPYGCHTCVDQICDAEPSCCGVAFDQACVDKVASVCGLVCE